MHHHMSGAMHHLSGAMHHMTCQPVAKLACGATTMIENCCRYLKNTVGSKYHRAKILLKWKYT